jgi:dethiobiotin synthetase
MSPIGRDFTNIDLIAALDARVLLVAGTYLGTISHTLTACEALAARGRKPWAIVLSESDDSPAAPDETARSIGRFVDTPIQFLPRHGELAADFADRILA